MPGGRYPCNYVYVFRLNDGHIKIGQAKETGKRFYRMFFGRGGSYTGTDELGHQPSRVVFTVECPADKTHLVESMALRILGLHFDFPGETLRCPEQTAILAVETAYAMIVGPVTASTETT